MEKRTALPRPPPARRIVSSCGISVGAPVGPMTTTGSPGSRYAQSGAELPLEERDDVRVAIFRRGHRLDDVAGVLWMVVAVERDALRAALVSGEEALTFDQLIARDRVRLEKLSVFVELERAGVLFFV